MVGLVAQAVLSTPEWQRAYLERIADLRANLFLTEKLTNRVHELSRRIRPTLAAYGLDVAEQHDAHVAHLCWRIAERARSISDQLNAPVEEPYIGSEVGVRPLRPRRAGVRP